MELCYKFSKCCLVGNSHHETHYFYIKKINKRKPIPNRHFVRRPLIPTQAGSSMAGGRVRSIVRLRRKEPLTWLLLTQRFDCFDGNLNHSHQLHFKHLRLTQQLVLSSLASCVARQKTSLCWYPASGCWALHLRTQLCFSASGPVSVSQRSQILASCVCLQTWKSLPCLINSLGSASFQASSSPSLLQLSLCLQCPAALILSQPFFPL